MCECKSVFTNKFPVNDGKTPLCSDTLFTIPSANMKQCELPLILLHELFSIYQQFCVYIV